MCAPLPQLGVLFRVPAFGIYLHLSLVVHLLCSSLLYIAAAAAAAAKPNRRRVCRSVSRSAQSASKRDRSRIVPCPAVLESAPRASQSNSGQTSATTLNRRSMDDASTQRGHGSRHSHPAGLSSLHPDGTVFYRVYTTAAAYGCTLNLAARSGPKTESRGWAPTHGRTAQPARFTFTSALVPDVARHSGVHPSDRVAYVSERRSRGVGCCRSSPVEGLRCYATTTIAATATHMPCMPGARMHACSLANASFCCCRCSLLTGMCILPPSCGTWPGRTEGDADCTAPPPLDLVHM